MSVFSLNSPEFALIRDNHFVIYLTLRQDYILKKNVFLTILVKAFHTLKLDCENSMHSHAPMLSFCLSSVIVLYLCWRQPYSILTLNLAHNYAGGSKIVEKVIY